MQIPDKASDVSLGHWGQVAKSSGAKVPGASSPDESLDVKSSGVMVPGAESPDEVLDVSLGHWGQVAVLSHYETPEVRLEHGVKVGAGTTDEAPGDEHRGLVVA